MAVMLNTRLLNAIIRYGNTATLVYYTGDQCPCMISRDSGRPQYSAEWHENNPAPDNENCLKTGLINKTAYNLTCLGFIYLVDFKEDSRAVNKYEFKEIGLFEDCDLVAIGLVNSSTNAFVDVSGLDRQTSVLTYKNIAYNIYKVQSIYINDYEAQIAGFKRKN